MITLPKNWVESMGMGKNDSVSLSVQSDGSLCVSPGIIESRMASEKTIQIDPDCDEEYLYRQLVGAYIAGHGTIRLTCDCEIPGTKAGVASAFTQTAIGLEIMEEDENSIVMKDLMDPSGIQPSKSVDRMKVLVRNMVNDVISSIEKQDLPSLITMADRDKEVDRLDWLIFRQVNMHQKDPLLSKITGTELFEISPCAYISRTIERIGDHVVLMSDSLTRVSDVSNFGFDIGGMCREMLKLFTDSVSTWAAKDMDQANQCIVKGEAMVSRILAGNDMIISDNEEEIIYMERVIGNIKRIVEYSMDIAEIAINGAMK